MAKIFVPPATGHFQLTPYLFKERFLGKRLSIRLLIGNCSIPIDFRTFGLACKQNKIGCIVGYTTSICDKFIFIIDMK